MFQNINENVINDEKYIKNKCNTVRIINEVLPEFRQYISGKFAEW